jgi:hypothetical protein
MKISQLSKTPTLTKITLDAEHIVTKYGEPIDFWMWDRQPLDVFAKLSTQDASSTAVLDIVSQLILNEEGKPVIVDGAVLPIDVITECMTKVGELLGK